MMSNGQEALNRVVRVVVADDHPLFRFGLCAALAGAPELEVVGEAADGQALVTLVERENPDVVLTDITMPGMNGISAILAILQKFPDIGILVLTMHEEDDAVFSAMRAGARGYVIKGAERDEIVHATLAVAMGATVYGPEIGQRITGFFTQGQQDYGRRVFPELTAREYEILCLVGGGLGNHEIARRLFLSDKTVRNHVSSILAKLHLRDRAAAVARARDAGLRPPSSQ